MNISFEILRKSPETGRNGIESIDDRILPVSLADRKLWLNIRFLKQRGNQLIHQRMFLVTMVERILGKLFDRGRFKRRKRMIGRYRDHHIIFCI